MNDAWCSRHGAVLRLAVQVAPNARKTEVVGTTGEVLKIRVQAPPIEGRANEVLIRYLADRLGIAKSGIAIRSGASGRRKLVEIRGVDLEPEFIRKTLGAND